jgi:hypothetical protein
MPNKHNFGHGGWGGPIRLSTGNFVRFLSARAGKYIGDIVIELK